MGIYGWTFIPGKVQEGTESDILNETGGINWNKNKYYYATDTLKFFVCNEAQDAVYEFRRVILDKTGVNGKDNELWQENYNLWIDNDAVGNKYIWVDTEWIACGQDNEKSFKCDDDIIVERASKYLKEA